MRSFQECNSTCTYTPSSTVIYVAFFSSKRPIYIMNLTSLREFISKRRIFWDTLSVRPGLAFIDYSSRLNKNGGQKVSRVHNSKRSIHIDYMYMCCLTVLLDNMKAKQDVNKWYIKALHIICPTPPSCTCMYVRSTCIKLVLWKWIVYSKGIATHNLVNVTLCARAYWHIKLNAPGSNFYFVHVYVVYTRKITSIFSSDLNTSIDW